MELQFANPWVLYLLWLVPAVAAGWYLSYQRHERVLATFISPAMQAKLRPASSNTRFVWQISLMAAGLLLMLIAAARPQWGTREEVVYQRSRDLVIALDVSRSMLANDVHPNRLQRAKADIMDLIRELPGDRVALVAFRRVAVLLCPLTTDYAYLRQALDAVTTESAPRGETNIGDAIDKAMQAFETDEGAHKAIILISDGEDLSGLAVTAAEKAGEKKIPIFAVGIGNRRGSTIPEDGSPSGTLKYKGESVVTKLNDDVLYTIANKTGGAYLPVETASMGNTTLGTLYRDYLRQLSGRDMEETLQRRHVERYPFFLLPAILLLLAGTFLSQGRLKTRSQPPSPGGYGAPRKPGGKTALLILFCALATGVQAQTNEPPGAMPTNAPAAPALHVPPGREGARLAQKFYWMGKYKESAQAYLEAARSAGETSSRDFRFNAAAALFKADQYKEAADVLKDLLNSDKGSREDVFMGLGSSLYRAAGTSPTESDADQAAAHERSLREAGEAFKEATRVRSDNDTARRNLAVVLNALPEAEEQALTAKLMAQYAQSPAGTIVNEMLTNQRKLVEEIPAAFSNTSPAQIKTLEGLATRQKSNAELWIPLKGLLLNELAQNPGNTNAQQFLAQVNQALELTRDTMLGASSALRDLDAEALRAATSSEKSIYAAFWKPIAPYYLVLLEDLRRQSNVISELPSTTMVQDDLMADQDEAAELTRLFRKKFAQEVPETGTVQTPPQDAPQTNAMEQAAPKGISAEDRKRILELAEQAETCQQVASQYVRNGHTADAVPDARKSYKLLKEIDDLLPKDSNQGPSESQQQEKKDEQKQDSSSQQQKPEPQESQPQPKQDEQKQEPKESEQKDATPEDVKKLIEKAMQREKDHEAEKRRMNNQFIPPSGIEKDW